MPNFEVIEYFIADGVYDGMRITTYDNYRSNDNGQGAYEYFVQQVAQIGKGDGPAAVLIASLPSTPIALAGSRRISFPPDISRTPIPVMGTLSRAESAEIYLSAVDKQVPIEAPKSWDQPFRIGPVFILLGVGAVLLIAGAGAKG